MYSRTRDDRVSSGFLGLLNAMNRRGAGYYMVLILAERQQRRGNPCSIMRLAC